MASSRKKQDEKHLKILRNLVSLPGNKQCFDCNQRGPTYVNVTIGSFVCTTCSGFLRGLTPPHRVKSISMATFTPEEIESLQFKGNEFCRKVWLALFDSNSIQNTKDEHLVRDFMVAKYEKKLYYVEPSAALKNGNSSLSGTVVECPKVQLPVSNSSLNTSLPIISSKFSSLKNNQTHSTVGTPVSSNFSFSDLFEPVGSSTSRKKNLQVGQQLPAQPQEQSFANFDNNPIFNSSSAGLSSFSNAKSESPSEDKYAALKELDCLMKMPQESSLSQGIHVNGWSSSNTNKNHTLNPFQTDIGNNNIVNPFRSGLILQTEKNLNDNSDYGNGNSNNRFSNICNSSSSSNSNNSNNNNSNNNNNNNNNNNLSTSNPINLWATTNSPWASNVLSTNQSTMPFAKPNWKGTGNLSMIPGNSNNPFL